MDDPFGIGYADYFILVVIQVEVDIITEFRDMVSPVQTQFKTPVLNVTTVDVRWVGA